MVRKDKKIRYKVIFEDKPYSYEECVILYKQLFVEILEADAQWRTCIFKAHSYYGS